MSSADMGMDIDGGILHLVPQETKLYFAFWAWSLSLSLDIIIKDRQVEHFDHHRHINHLIE